ncbi:MAG: hypothetical protein R3C68_08265 [Myxococcota bacterium]
MQAKVGRSSLRRKAHLLSRRQDLQLVDIRGNIPTRLDKVMQGELDAVVLAHAGLQRLDLLKRAQANGLTFSCLDLQDVCPAPAQGALAVQIRRDDEQTNHIVRTLHHAETAKAVETERELLRRFAGGGCHLPLGAYCEVAGTDLFLRALVAAPPDGSRRIEAAGTAIEPFLGVGKPSLRATD